MIFLEFNQNLFQKLIPAFRYIFSFLKKKQKGCRYNQGYETRFHYTTV